MDNRPVSTLTKPLMRNSRVARLQSLDSFMVDFAPPSADEDAAGNGKFFRCVVNVQTTKET
jgi:hypothetical protein